MVGERRHSDEELGFSVSPRFSEDLNELFSPAQKVFSAIDEAVLETARRHLVRRQRNLWWIRWAVPATAAAAVIVVASILCINRAPTADVERTSQLQVAKDSYQAQESLASSIAQADIDQNGRVDILDAFKLARHIESGQTADSSWDINGDGLVNRKDVDKVAFAAVRLDKGVL